ncbi:recombination-associated protein RdgC [Chromobacterium haemolyticum]|uniref:recombination-associated protein RdgC n=1 Tax=Chromobacterium haemolyticum TaxID=394935 RepID=UPI000D2F489D|nr:recombination-associated protein RdgC [Chromobacterium haemolyticum]PTU70801.1 hypothetical protein DBB33_15750 [Chromobacterium haemolyticum]
MSLAFYKNLSLFHILGGRSIVRLDIEESLGFLKFAPPSALQLTSTGFVNPLTLQPDDELTYAANQCVFFALRTDEKQIPKAALDQLVAAKVAEVEEREQRKVGKKWRRELQEQVIESVLPTALPKQSLLRGYFDLRQRLLVVDSTSASKLDELTGALTKNLFLNSGNGISFLGLKVEQSAADEMTRWVKEGEAPFDSFTIDDQGEIIKTGDDAGAIRIAHLDMLEPDIINLLCPGRAVNKLGLTWDSRISFVISAQFQFSKLAWGEAVQLRIAEQGAETVEDHRDASMTIMTGDVRELVYRTGECFGGIKVPDEDEKNPRQIEQEPVSYDGGDALASEALRIVTMTGKASISHLQRNMQIGFNRAARLLEHLESVGVVSPMDAKGNRDVLIATERAAAA